MDLEVSLAELQAEASCPVCLDYLTDPVTIECGHNVCGSCIHQWWEGLQDIFPCPVCLHHCPDRDFRRKPQLRHMTDMVKQIPTMRKKRKRQENPLCEQHQEDLILFCEKDLELLCPQCNVGSDHPDCPLKPIEEAAASQSRKLKSYIEPLEMDIEDAEMGNKNQAAKALEVKRKTENWRRGLYYECKDLKHSLEVEHYEVNASLRIEEKDVEEKLTENGRQISNHMFTLNNLLREIVEKCLQTDLDLLTGIESTHNRYENLETPAVFCYELKKESFTLPPHYFGLQKMMSTFQVDLSLDPETAHPSLIGTRDRKSVTYSTAEGLREPQAPSSAAVLSSQGSAAGRQFWQVEIGGSGECFLGVWKESCPQNTLIAPSPSNGYLQPQLCTSSTPLLLILCTQHSFPEPSSLYPDLILALLALERLCSLTCLLIYTGEEYKQAALTKTRLQPAPYLGNREVL
ncbi:LOW QUALITY PROTEIN: tripartite motif-containing protein 60-like [Molossus nigricans]